MTQLGSSASVDPPLPVRHKWVATATVSIQPAQESKAIASDPLVPEPEGGTLEQGALLIHS